MAGTKRFDAIRLDTFNAFFQRLGLAGQVREELLTEVRATTRRVLDIWGRLYEGNGVPEGWCSAWTHICAGARCSMQQPYRPSRAQQITSLCHFTAVFAPTRATNQ